MSRDSDSAKRFATLDPMVRCIGKQRFESPTLAKGIARKGNRRNDRNYSHYRCGNCGFWHLGGAPKGLTRTNLDTVRRKRALQRAAEGDDQ